MVARVLFPWLTSWGNMIPPHPRATMKALPAALHPPSPLRSLHLHFVRLMPMRADKSAMCAINRHLLDDVVYLPASSSMPRAKEDISPVLSGVGIVHVLFPFLFCLAAQVLRNVCDYDVGAGQQGSLQMKRRLVV